MARLRLSLLIAVIGLFSSGTVWAQDAGSSMEDALNAIEQQPTDPAPTSDAAKPAATNADLQRITPPDSAAPQPAVPTGTMVKPTVTDTEPTEFVPAKPLENMNPALMPQTPGDEAPKAVRAETKPIPPKPPAYEPRPYVTLQTLDKVTARTAQMTVKVGDTVAIGPLFVQVKTCQQSAPLETPDSAAFLQIWEAKPKDALLATPAKTDNGPSQWVFSGWMFASSPALSAMDHPIYDIWVLNCKKSANDVAEKSAAEKPAEPVAETTENPAPASADETAPDEEAPAAAPVKSLAKTPANKTE